ncbi:MAG: glycosyltransferase family 2 protein [Luteibaculaceae bacterium]
MKQPTLSVIILNYNVKGFLEQCLHSVEKAIEQLDTEVWVVDNNSQDGSVGMVQQKFPWVKLIVSKVNLGFSGGNNLAICKANGKYILLLNPDTVVPEDCFVKTVQFLEKTPNAGGLGVRMVDGKGNFLPESKRGLPTPLVALAKIAGLSSFFPESKVLGKYYMGYLPQHETNPVEILSGAFMMMPKHVIDKVGSLDDTFFMYGEDIDLSYRILLGGFQNYYFADTTIIHYKGESTKKNSFSYVKNFYLAMVIFAKKHLSQGLKFGVQFIKLAVYFRALLALSTRFIKPFLTPLADVFALVFLASMLHVSLPVFAVLLFLVSAFFSGLYQRNQNNLLFLRTIFTSLVPVFIYLFLKSASGAVSLMLAMVGSIYFIRYLNQGISGKKWFSHKQKPNHYAIVAPHAELFEEHVNQVKIANLNYGDFYFVQTSLAWQTDVLAVLDSKAISEVVIDTTNLSWKSVIEFIERTKEYPVDIKITAQGTNLLIGSNTVAQTGKVLEVPIYKIENERLWNFKIAIEFLLLPLVLIKFLTGSKTLRQEIAAKLVPFLTHKKRLIGYSSAHDAFSVRKNQLGNPLISVQYLYAKVPPQINEIYASDYRVIYDLKAFWRWFTTAR